MSDASTSGTAAEAAIANDAPSSLQEQSQQQMEQSTRQQQQPTTTTKTPAPRQRQDQLQLVFRQVVPTDIGACFDIEKASYPREEAASKSSLQYRQHFAEKYFRCCCVLTHQSWSVDDHDDNDDGRPVDNSTDNPSINNNDNNNQDGDNVNDNDTQLQSSNNNDIDSSHHNHHEYEEHYEIVGFICATRCRVFTEEAMATHDATGPLLAIHSVVVSEAYRRHGIGTAMIKNYIQTMESMPDGVDKIVLMAKQDLLGFYVKSGFSVLGPSDIVHGKEQWFHLERPKEIGVPCWVVDAFAETAGEGNPAAVVLLPNEPQDREWCQKVAKEFNLSETAFIWKLDGPPPGSSSSNVTPKPSPTNATSSGHHFHYGIRYYTANGTEVDLCGHATLASAAVLFQQFFCPSITFYSKFDQLVMTPAKYGTARKMHVSMNFPQKELVDTDSIPNNSNGNNNGNIRAAIVDMLQRAFPHIQDRIEGSIIYTGIDQDGNDLLVEVTPELLHDIGHEDGDVVYSAFLDWDGYRRGVIVCCCHDEDAEDDESLSMSSMNINNSTTSTTTSKDVDFVSRFFGPKCGIPEDPVTGSAHCVLAPYFAQKLGKTELKAEQLSRRGGKLTCVLENYRVTILGSAIITFNGTCWIEATSSSSSSS
ncbi:Phenazine biosynthesis-like protein [Fragilaria crotonensis]|nr:Phenazine biosynthesis-like protein [Fragilaria crotonensis]